ncbi:flavohemoglobin expression-modulating QEGLA motif protein [Tahibacter amnicola]|uniref:Flavohemoglobin expression-modulating QEGLA motif protein n=1 Tax=Tahibacter amnicola TaxID=2976241 RepID=A0ABY6BGC9_9GAMM|nr:flavohemoglobin expression-modulating QEGLA motif protein [Tahibacter amnicola]UXI68837.1 flavohemoglobin expression-modulating QEGLA motif protein [Tahibacter amnicola]
MAAVGVIPGESDVLARCTALDRRLVAAVRGIRLLQAISWPATAQESFLSDWQNGRRRLPTIHYAAPDLAEERAELIAIHDEAPAGHPIGEYLRRSADSWRVATQLLESVGTSHITEHSVRLYGRPGDKLPGAELTNLDAARHFIGLAGELDQEILSSDADYCIPAETLRAELQQQLDAFFQFHKIQVEIDPELLAKAAAGPTRIRLRSATCFSEYDRHQLVEHEAFVHSLTGLNGREQPNLQSLGRSSPRVTATQEGLAVFAELMSGSIDIERMKRISLRIVAIHMALAGADFIEVFQFFLESGQTEADSFASAQRVFRGAPVDGGVAFTKDNVYLHGLLTVHTFFRWALKHRRLALCHALFAGKMALHDVIALEPYFDSGYLAQPLYLPPWAKRANGLAGMLAFSLFANHIRIARVEAEDLVLGL